MKLNVKINETTYAVEIEDLNARPIIAIVNGERFEVAPENRAQPTVKKEAGVNAEIAPKRTGPSSAAASSAKILPAPLPGVVAEIFVKVGERVESGQIVFVIEAMKMKNSIRAPRAGKVAALLATVGQTVTHKQPLLEFE
ncbi:MAG: hypothetical protein HFACDABA_00572 [Anaerolineales bacterium]|nr:hypothetical protein [Anaerolineales bacterium]